MVTTTCIKGKDSEASSSNSLQFVDNESNERKRNELFHIRVISKHNKTNNLNCFDFLSQILSSTRGHVIRDTSGTM